jgi:hypothetical protein
MNIADSAGEFAALVRRIDEGDTDCLARMSAYPQWLRQHFGRDNAANIIEEDFGAPLRDARVPVAGPGGEAVAEVS